MGRGQKAGRGAKGQALKAQALPWFKGPRWAWMETWGPWALALLFLLSWLPRLEATYLREVDELIHAIAAQGAARDGHWMPFYHGPDLWFEKPPLLIWLAA